MVSCIHDYIGIVLLPLHITALSVHELISENPTRVLGEDLGMNCYCFFHLSSASEIKS